MQQVVTTFRHRPAVESPDFDGGEPFGWSIRWAQTPTLCVDVLVDMGGPRDVPQARRLAQQIASTARPTTYNYFRSLCKRVQAAIANPKVHPRVPIPDPCRPAAPN
jgi:hypothetical protein